MKSLTLPIIDRRFENVSAVIVKLTHRCNLDCSYCYENIVAGEDMKIEVFKSLVDRVLPSTRSKKVQFIFHGGEPTLLPLEWFIEATEYARSQADQFSKKINFGLQTNMISVDENMMQLFKNLEIQISLSLDGPSYLPAPMRPRAERVLSNFQKAREIGLRMGILMTINHSNFSYFREIMRWLEEELTIRFVKVNTVTAVGKGLNLPNLTAEQIFIARREILEHMIATKGLGVIEDNLVVELLRYFSVHDKRPESLCRDKDCGAGRLVIDVTPKGDILPCGRFQWDNHEYFLGHLTNPITETTLQNFTTKIKDFKNLKPENWSECYSCAAAKICSFGCQAFIVRSKEQINVECSPTRMTYQYFQQNESRLYEIVENIRNRGQKLQIAQNYGDSNYNDSWPNYDDYSNYANYSDSYSDSTDSPDPITPP